MKRLARNTFFATVAVFIIIGFITNPVLFYGQGTAAPAVDTARLRAEVSWLANTPFPRNVDHPELLDSAAQWIKKKLQQDGIASWEQTYEVNGKTYRNIVCSFGPRTAKRVIVGAHYDVCGDQAGADDNASGTVGLLELARLLKKNNPALHYRTDLVFYTLEEPPSYDTPDMGSFRHAKSLRDSSIEIKAMVCLEMIGYFSDKPKSQQYPVGLLKLFYPSKADYIAVVGKLGQGALVRKVKRNMQRGCAINVRSINAPKFIPGIDFSDHRSYWNFGYEAVMITNTAFYRNKNYHQPGDVPASLDYGRMAEVIKGAYAVVCGF